MNIEKIFKKNGYDMSLSEKEALSDYTDASNLTDYLEEIDGMDFTKVLVDDIEEYVDFNISDFEIEIYSGETTDGQDCAGGVLYYNDIPLIMNANQD